MNKSAIIGITIATLFVLLLSSGVISSTAQSPTASPYNIFFPAARKYYSPSKDSSTYVHVTYGDPSTLDPAVAYETAAGGIIMNIYDTLVYYNRGDPNDFIPQLATVVPTLGNGGISPDGKTFIFYIRPGVQFSDGTPLTAQDVAYSFQRGILRGGSSSPQWMLVEPILGVGKYDITNELDPDGSLGLIDNPTELQNQPPAALLAACNKVTGAIVADNNAGTVTFHLAQSWAPFLATIANTLGSIQSQTWVSSQGGWDGDCATWQNYYLQNVDAFNQNPVGSGPYKLHHWTPGVEIVLEANLNYWRSSPAWSFGPTGAPRLKTVIIKNISDFNQRFALLQAGDADSITLGSPQDAAVLDLLVGEIFDVNGVYQPGADPALPLRLHTGLPGVSRTDVFFTWIINVTGGNPLIGSGILDGNGIPPDFFSDGHVRKAFAYCFNYDAYGTQVLNGSGVRSIHVMLPGMIGYDPNAAYYDYDLVQCEQEFKTSTWTGPGGASLWDTGFHFSIAYNTGNTSRQKLAEIFQQELASLNPKFVIDIVGYDWTTFSWLSGTGRLPIFINGWLEDIHDPHNWVVPYTVGTYGTRQGMPYPLMEQFRTLVNAAVSEPNPANRAAIYGQFNQLYYDNSPAVLLFVATGRRYEQRWVQGWYYNPIYPGTYYYSLYKW